LKISSEFGGCYPKASTKNKKICYKLMHRCIQKDMDGIEYDTNINIIVKEFFNKWVKDVYINPRIGWDKFRILQQKKVGKQKHRNKEK
jgi:hypothetical protein